MKPRQPQFSKIFAAHDSPEERAQFAAVLWTKTVSEVGANGPITEGRLVMIRRYVLLATEYEFYYSSATFEAPVKSGPNGGDVFSMSWAAILKMGDQLLKIEDALLISPKAAGMKSAAAAPESLPSAAEKYLSRSKPIGSEKNRH